MNPTVLVGFVLLYANDWFRGVVSQQTVICKHRELKIYFYPSICFAIATYSRYLKVSRQKFKIGERKGRGAPFASFAPISRAINSFY